MVKSGKYPCSTAERTPLKRGAWSAEEDQKLIHYIKRYKIWNWNEMSKAAGLARSGKSCRLRWVNYLRPDIKHGNFSKEEEETIMSLHETLGNRWSSIASKLPGRTDNEVKNFWHTHLKKRLNRKISQGSETSNIVYETSSKKTPHSPNSLEGLSNTFILESHTDQPMTTHNDLCQNVEKEKESMFLDNIQHDESALAEQKAPEFITGDTNMGQTFDQATFFDIGSVGEAAWEDAMWPYDFYDSYWLDNLDISSFDTFV